MRFAALHNHTVHSIKDAIAHPKDYVNFIHKYNETQTEHEIVALAITEHGNMFSTVLAHEACTTPRKSDKLKKTIKPIYGNEIYHVDNLKTSVITKASDLNHLVLLAKDDEGYSNLCRITTNAGMNKRKPSNRSQKEFQITDIEFMKSHGKGVIALSACYAGKLGQLITEDKMDEAKAFIRLMEEIFDEFYLEIQPHDTFEEQMNINYKLLELHKELGTKLVITSDAHYVVSEDRQYHDVMKQIDGMEGFTTDNHFWTPDELAAWCNVYGFPLECIENTALISDMCTADITPKDRKGLMPDFPCPKGYNDKSYLNTKVYQGLLKRIDANPKIDFKEYSKRLTRELEVICNAGFASYFLILWDWVKFCESKKIPIGPGRGSAAGSLVAYCLRITNIDPIKNELYFDRFLNEERLDEPDVDTDLSKTHRRESIQYFIDKYGKDHVCQIVTFGQYKLKNTIKALLTAERGFTSEFQNSITKKIPDKLGDYPVTYKTIMDIHDNPEDFAEDLTDKEMKAAAEAYNKLQEVFKDYPEVKMALERLFGAYSQTGIHAGGVIISSKPIRDHVPLMAGSGTAVLPVCQTDMHGVSFCRFLKIDCLGLKTLSQISVAMEIIGLDNDWYFSEDTYDEKVYAHLREGNTTNVFQMYKHVPTKMIKDFNVEDLDGLSAVNAGNRPGPLAKDDTGLSMVDRYTQAVKYDEIDALHQLIDPILEPTKGQIWFQEQCMALGQVMAGYTLGSADLRIRKIIAKRLLDKIPEVKNEFVYGKKSIYDEDGKVIGISDEDSPLCVGSIRNGFSEELAIKVFEWMEAFASYAFNRSHSTAYALVAYKTAWLLYYYPVEWSIACLTLDSKDGGDRAKISILNTFNYCKKKEIRLLPPDINRSDLAFTLDYDIENKKAIRFGLLGINGVGEKVIGMLMKIREIDGEFESFEDFFNRTCNPKLNTTLMNICLKDDEFSKIDKNGIRKAQNPFSMRNIVPLILCGAFDNINDNRFETLNLYYDLKKDKAKERMKPEEYTLKEKLKLELDLLGYYVSQHPLDGPEFPYVDLDHCIDNERVKIAGILKEATTANTKKGTKYYKLKIEVRDGSVINVNIFDSAYGKNKNMIKGLYSNKAKEGHEILIIEGKWSKQYSNINASNVLKVRAQEEQIEEVIEEIIPLETESESIYDDIFSIKVS